MKMELVPVALADASLYLRMQRDAFRPLLLQYRDLAHSPTRETLVHVLQALRDPRSEILYIVADGRMVGGLKTTKKRAGRYRLGRLFILPSVQNRGYASQAIALMERRYPDATSWELDTIAQEKANCHLYRKMGYRWTGHITICNRRMTLVDFVKIIRKD